MAKQLEGDRHCQLVWDGTTYTLRYTAYPDPTDDSDATITYRRIGSNESSRALTAEELSGTLQAFLDGLDSGYETAEGIS
jgi:hypothetical protein